MFKLSQTAGFIAAGVILFSSPLAAEDQTPIATAIHTHSNISSGAKTISEMASLAKRQNVNALVITDLYNEHYEYGLWPLRNLLKVSYDRESIQKLGATHYLEQIQKASEKTPEVTLVDGTAVTPFYYWTGGFGSGPFVLNSRAKDLLVLGLGSAEAYNQLPTTGNRKSAFNAYDGDQYSKPYQEFIDAALKLRGLVYWSHPRASEHLELKQVAPGVNILLDTPPYEDSLRSTFRYTGFGIFSTELVEIHSPGHVSIATPEGLWDELLYEYCQGQREKPIWVISETDYNGYPDGINDLDAILTMIITEQKNPQALLNALKEGSSYVIIPSSHDRRLVLRDFTVQDSSSHEKAALGGSAALSPNGFPQIHFQIRYSDASEGGELHVLLIRNKKIIKTWDESIPFEIHFDDTENSEPGKSYYRLVAYSQKRKDRLLSNPIFTERR